MCTGLASHVRLLKQLPRIWQNQAQERRKISANSLSIEPIPNLFSVAKYQSSVYVTFFIAPDKWPDNFRGIPGKAEQLDIGWTVSTLHFYHLLDILEQCAMFHQKSTTRSISRESLLAAFTR